VEDGDVNNWPLKAIDGASTTAVIDGLRKLTFKGV